MRKFILNWLFGTDNVERYIELLAKNIQHGDKCIGLINEHLKTLNESKEELDIMRKLIKICQNYNIDIDKEINQIEL